MHSDAGGIGSNHLEGNPLLPAIEKPRGADNIQRSRIREHTSILSDARIIELLGGWSERFRCVSALVNQPLPKPDIVHPLAPDVRGRHTFESTKCALYPARRSFDHKRLSCFRTSASLRLILSTLIWILTLIELCIDWARSRREKYACHCHRRVPHFFDSGSSRDSVLHFTTPRCESIEYICGACTLGVREKEFYDIGNGLIWEMSTSPICICGF